MDVYTSENEQAEALKQWWKENGKSVIAGLVLGLSVVFGWRAWVSYQHDVAERASLQYEQLMQAVEGGDAAAARALGGEILQEFNGTSYGFLSALALGRIEVEAGNLQAAREHLEWALQHAPDPSLEHVARLRLARVMLAQGQAKPALGLIPAADAGAFAAQYKEVEGDIQAALGNAEQARAAYREALQSARGASRQWLEMKLNDLGEEVAP